MKGYIAAFGYMGWIGGRWQLFASEAEYEEAYEDQD